MSIKKLVQTGENNEGEFKVMDGLSFARALNNNADELETTTKVDLAVHNTPEALRKAMKEQSGKIGFHTPGGPDDLPTSEQTVSEQKGGVAQIYNEALKPEPEPTLVRIEVTTEPTKVQYTEGETFDPTGMVVTATYSDETTEEVTDYTYEPTEALTTEDTEVTITYEDKTTTQAITVVEDTPGE